MQSPEKQRSPREAGHGAHAGRLGASRDYTMAAALYLASVAMEAAQAQLEAWARLTDEPSPLSGAAARRRCRACRAPAGGSAPDRSPFGG